MKFNKINLLPYRSGPVWTRRDLHT